MTLQNNASYEAEHKTFKCLYNLVIWFQHLSYFLENRLFTPGGKTGKSKKTFEIQETGDLIKASEKVTEASGVHDKVCLINNI